MQSASNIIRRLAAAATAMASLAMAFAPQIAMAAAGTYASAPTTVRVGDTVNVAIYVNTGGQSANTYQGTLSYPSFLTGVRGTYSGSVCNMPITQPDPSGGSATYSCGTTGGFNGNGLVATVIFTANADGTGAFGMSGCKVLANDGKGTNITGSCSGTNILVVSAVVATPVPTAQATAKTTVRTTNTTTATAKPAETPAVVASTPTPTPPPVQALTSATPTPVAEATKSPEIKAVQRRSIGQALTDFLSSMHELSRTPKNMTGFVALLVILIPLLLLLLALAYFFYRIYLLEKRRRRAQERLFELELTELAALEGKMDLLADKGPKGREEYRQEFRKVKDTILRQIHPEYDTPVDPPASVSGA